MDADREEVRTLLDDGWSLGTLELAIGTGFRCAYCETDFFVSVDACYSVQVEHIVPLTKEGRDEPSNKTVACKTCNFFKRAWDPRTVTGPEATREELLEAARKYVMEIRKQKEQMVSREREAARKIMARMPA
jgi:5-methylcytosine-specific restriction endonuclease McrA